MSTEANKLIWKFNEGDDPVYGYVACTAHGAAVSINRTKDDGVHAKCAFADCGATANMADLILNSFPPAKLGVTTCADCGEKITKDEHNRWRHPPDKQYRHVATPSRFSR